MKIIIVGAGEVGTHLAKMLATENQDIVLLDENEDRLRPLEANYDLMAIKGNPISLTDLKEAGVSNADLFIAVTPEESKNMTACMLATNMGAVTTVARIDNYEYLLPRNRDFFKSLGVDHLIYPEMLAAKEIVNSLKRIWVRQWLDFHGGELILIAIKVRADAPIVNRKLGTFSTEKNNFRIVAIKRKTDTIIPNGEDEVMANDTVYFMTTQTYISNVRKLCGKEEVDIHNVMMMGGSRIAIKTAQYLPDNVQVKIVERNREKAYRVLESVKNALIINGDASDVELLKEEGIQHMDAFVAATGNSEANVLACLAAQRVGVKKTIAEVENIDYMALAEALEIGTIINKKQIAANYIYQLTLDADVAEIKSLTNVGVDVIEFIVKENAKITKAQIKDLNLPRDFFIGGIIRNGTGIIVTGDTHVQAEDRIVVFCYTSKIRKIEKFFS